MLSLAPGSNARWWHLLDLLTGFLIALAIIAALTGSVKWHWGFISLSASRPSRLLMEATILLLVRALFASRHLTAPAWRPAFWGLFLALLVTLVAGSNARRVGDAGEYLAMALNLSHFRPPAVSNAELASIEAELGRTPGYESSSLRMPALEGADGRQDFPHFWFYSALAAPSVRLFELTGIHPAHGFTLVNALFLMGIAWLMLGRLPPAPAMLLVAGPIIWWIDKPHTEILTFAAISAAFLLLDEAPWWSLVALGAAATQNPAIIFLIAIISIYAIWKQRGADIRLWAAVITAGSLAALHPLYYRMHLGRWSSLETAVIPHWPNGAELTAVLWDPNLGILEHFPALGAVLALAFGYLILSRVPTSSASAWRRRRSLPSVLAANEGRGRSRGPEAGIFVAGLSGLLLLFFFAQTPNANHGGTPNPSRYGLWLIPLSIPLLRLLGSLVQSRGQLALAAITSLSIAWSSYAFHPKLPDHYTNPTRLAATLWSRWPALNNPLPEVFAERVTGHDGEHVLPVTTFNCDKILLAGGPQVAWPLPCRAFPVPDSCAESGVLCYANRRGRSYTFTRAPAQPGFGFRVAEEWTLGGAHSESRALQDVNWQALRYHRDASRGSFIAKSHGVGWIHALQNDRELVAWLERPEPGATMVLQAPQWMWGVLFDADDGKELARFDVPGGRLKNLSVPAGKVFILRLKMQSR